MKKMIVVALMLATVSVKAQDLGGVGQAISDIALSARGGTGVNLKGRIDGLMFIPFPSIHSADGQTEYGVLGLGADLSDGVDGTKLHGAPLILPLVNPFALSGYLFRSNWLKTHSTFTKINVEAGIGIKPLPVPGSHGKFVIGNQVEGATTFHFGKTTIASPAAPMG